jgi:2-dehydropantoate 2-reductase
MKITVVGAGAMGSLFGALLTESGHDVWLCDIRQDFIDALTHNGLTVESDAQTRVVKLNAAVDPRQIGASDLVLIFVKSIHTEAAARTAALLAGRRGLVMTLQNGMGNAEAIAEQVNPERIIVGTTAHGATLLRPAVIRHAGKGPTTLGMWAGGKRQLPIARQIAARLTRAEIQSTAVEDVRPVIWDKLMINVGINAITALTGIKNGQMLDLEETRQLSRTAVEEAAAVAKAWGVEIRQDPAAHVLEVARATSANRSSMGQDVDHRRPSEIAAINGFVVREADRLKLNAPVNRTLTVLMQTLEAHYRK